MDGAEWKRCSAGVFDVKVLNRKGSANDLDFDFEEFVKRTPQWEVSPPRPEPEYPISYDIKMDDVCGDLTEFSVNKFFSDGKRRSVKESIKDYVFSVDGVKNMFCLHPASDPHEYYARTVIEAASKMSKRSRKNFPLILVITNTDSAADHVYRKLHSIKNFGANSNSAKCFIWNLMTPPEGPKLFGINNKRAIIDVAVGSAAKVVQYIQKLKTDRELEMLQLSVKHIFLAGTEELPVDSTFYGHIQDIANTFKFSPTTFIFLYDYSNTSCTPMRAHKACSSLVRADMYIEMDKHESQDIFDRIEFIQIIPAAEFVDGLIAETIQSKQEVYDNMFATAQIVMTESVQKLYECSELIEQLRCDRQTSNRENKKSRKERILIICKDAPTAIRVWVYLKEKPQESQLQPFKVDRMLEYDTYETVELLNFEFRWENLDVLVIDWKSIQAVNRGTVDAVIFHDAPEKKYFQTLLETEMQCLVSRNCVKIKMFILFDKKEDILFLVKYAKLLKKYEKRVPQWFHALYDKYRQKWFEQRLINSQGAETNYVPVALC